jgi:hypothetical protein
MVKCFGSAAVEKWPIMCCKMKKEKVNPHLVFVGPRNLMEGFLENQDVQDYLFISANYGGFKAWAKSKERWLPQFQKFDFSKADMNENYVLYTRAGNSVMTSLMTRSQFEREKTLGKEVTPAGQPSCNKVELPDYNAGGVDLPDYAYPKGSVSIERKLGEGSFSVVFLVQSQAHQFALKMTRQEDLRREADVGRFLSTQKHPFLVKSFAVFALPEYVKWETACGQAVEGTFDVAILLEYIEGGTLWSSIIRDENNKPERTGRLKRYRR